MKGRSMKRVLVVAVIATLALLTNGCADVNRVSIGRAIHVTATTVKCQEDDPCWDADTMGNKGYGPEWNCHTMGDRICQVVKP